MSNYDVVIATLKEKRDALWKMTERNMTSEYLGMSIIDDIRLEQIAQLDKAMKLWIEHNRVKTVHSCDIPGCVACGNPESDYDSSY